MSLEIINNLPFNEYLALNRLSSSVLKDFYKSPKYMLWRKSNPMKENDSLKIGTMVHTWLLENHKFNHDYHLMPKIDRRTKAGKEEYAAHLESAGNKILIESDTVKKFTHLKPYNDTKNEVTVLFDYCGVKCKARFDVLHDNGIEDIKTINDIFKVEKQFNQLAYFIQAGFYMIAFKEAFGKWPQFFKFTFISTNDFVVKETFEMAFDYMEIAKDRATEQILLYKDCLEKDHFPLGFNTTLETPFWL